MNRKKAEKRIRDLLVEIAKVSKEYGTKDYLTLSVFTGDGYVAFNNRCYYGDSEDSDHPLDYHEFGIDF